MKLFALVLATSSLASCPTVVINPPAQTAASICAKACARLEKLKCESSKPTPDGLTCLQVCEVSKNAKISTVHPECVVNAKTCPEAEEFSSKGCGDAGAP